MAQRKKSIRKKGNRVTTRLCSSKEDGPVHTYTTQINKQNQKMNQHGKLQLKKYHPVLRKYVTFTETKMPPHSK